MNSSVYIAAERLVRPIYFEINKEYIYYVSWAKKANMEKPIRIIIVDLEFHDGICINATFYHSNDKTQKRLMLTQTSLERAVFKLEDEQKCNALFCKAMSFYQPHQIKKKDKKFIDEFSSKYPELMI